MTGRRKRRSIRNADFKVVVCPLDPVIGDLPLQPIGSIYHREETGLMILNGAMPSGAILTSKDEAFLVYGNDLYPYDLETDMPDETPAYSVAPRSNSGGVTWTDHRKDTL